MFAILLGGVRCEVSDGGVQVVGFEGLPELGRL